MDDKKMRNSAGLTEEEFLEEYQRTRKKYPAPYLTADNVIFKCVNNKDYLLLIRRGNHPWIGKRALPGGFVDPNETALQAAERELEEETGIKGLPSAPVGFYSDPKRDPRHWIVTQAFFSVYQGELQAEAGDDARDADWFEIQELLKGSQVVLMLVHGEEKLTIQGRLGQNPVSKQYEIGQVRSDGLACDHAQIIADAWLAMRYAKSQSI